VVEPTVTVDIEHPDVPKLEAAVVPVDLVPKLEPAVKPVTNTARAVAPEDVVATIDRVESVPKVERNDLRPRRPGDVTNAARQSRWRGKQDAAALRLEAQVRMRLLRARRRAARP
jgi:hypothetical protein